MVEESKRGELMLWFSAALELRLLRVVMLICPVSGCDPRSCSDGAMWLDESGLGMEFHVYTYYVVGRRTPLVYVNSLYQAHRVYEII